MRFVFSIFFSFDVDKVVQPLFEIDDFQNGIDTVSAFKAIELKRKFKPTKYIGRFLRKKKRGD